MMESGMLRRLFGIDMLHAAENKARFDTTHGIEQIKLRTHDALCAVPHLLSR